MSISGGIVRAALALLVLAAPGGGAWAQQVPDGRVVKLPGPCLTRAADGAPWDTLSLEAPALKEGQRIKCTQAGEVQIILPGNQLPHRFHLETGVEYVVPLGQRLPSLRLQPGARLSRADEGTERQAGAAAALERCDAPLGTLALGDGRGQAWMAEFTQATRVDSVLPLLRLAVQQSNCFVVAEVATRALTERQLAQGGELRGGIGRGALLAADYYLNPQILLQGPGSGRTVGSLGGLIGGIAGGAAPGKASVVTLTLTDVRSGVQIAAADGKGQSTGRSAVMAGAFGAGGAAGVGDFSRTPEGQATMAAFVEAYNQMVLSLRAQQAQPAPPHRGTDPGKAGKD